MSEPVTLYKDGKTLVIAAPSEARRMIDDGWTTTQPAPAPEAVEPEPQFVAKRGRPKK